LFLALALLFVANAQPGFLQVIYWDDCNCNGTALKVVATASSNISGCVATTADTCDVCRTSAPTDAPLAVGKKRGIDLNIGDIGESSSCVNNYASMNPAPPAAATWSGFIEWDNSTCDGAVTGWTEYLIGTCFDDENEAGFTFTVSCDASGSGSLSNYTSDEFCNSTTPTTGWSLSQTCDLDQRTSTCTIITEAPTEAPTEVPTETPVAVGTIYDVKELCKITTLRSVFEAALSVGVLVDTEITSVCTIGNCQDTLDYTGAKFKYTCKPSGSGVEFNETTASQICPSIAATTASVLGLPFPAAVTCNDLRGKPTGTQGYIIIAPLEATGPFVSYSLFVLVAMLLVNLF
jgi:hypothetical protein